MPAWVMKYWKVLAAAGGAILLAALVMWATSAWQARAYDKASRKYHEDEQAWQKERSALLQRAEDSEKRAAELEPKAAAFDALAQQHKAADAKLVEQIEEVSRDAKEKEAVAEQPTDCRVRAVRICDMLRARIPGYDCAALIRDSCGAG